MTIESVIGIITTEMNAVRTELHSWCEADIQMLGFRPRDGGWTSLQILEHIVLTSHYLMMIIDKATVKASQRSQLESKIDDLEGYELLPKTLEDIGIHKSFLWLRPSHMEPKNDISINDIRVTLRMQFEKCEQHLITLKHGEGMLCKTTMSVNNIGKLDVYQYIYFLILHAKRHLTQLEENKTEFQFQRPCN